MKFVLIVPHGQGNKDLEYVPNSNLNLYLPNTIPDFTVTSPETKASDFHTLTGTLQQTETTPNKIPEPNIHSVFSKAGWKTGQFGRWFFDPLPHVNTFLPTDDPELAIQATVKFMKENADNDYVVVLNLPLVDISYMPNVDVVKGTTCIDNVQDPTQPCAGQIYASSRIQEDKMLKDVLDLAKSQDAYTMWFPVHGGISQYTHTNSQPRSDQRGQMYSLYQGGIGVNFKYNPGTSQKLLAKDGNAVDILATLSSIAGLNKPKTDGIALNDAGETRSKPLEWMTSQRAEGSCIHTSPARAKQITIDQQKYKLLYDAKRTEVYQWGKREFTQANVKPEVPSRVKYSLDGCKLPTATGISKNNNKTPEIKYVICIMADDLPMSALSFQAQEHQGSQYSKTPNIDKMAENGVYFTKHNSPSVCTMTRSEYLTGIPSMDDRVAAFGVYAAKGKTEINQGVPPYIGYRRNIKFLTKFLQERGISTGHFGKWHLEDPTGPDISTFGIDADGHKTFNSPERPGKNYKHTAPGFPAISSEMITTDALNWLDKKVASGKKAYVNIWHYVAHAGLSASPEDLERFGYGNANSPSLIKGTSKYKHGSAEQIFHGLIHEMDRNVGRVIEWAEKNNVADSTVILFLSDNGGEASSVHKNSVGFGIGKKRSLKNDNLRTAAILYAPGFGWRGVSDTLLSVTDWYPTIASMFGYDTTKENATKNIHGKNLIPCFNDSNECKKINDRVLFYEARGGIRGDCLTVTPRFAIVDSKYKGMVDSPLKRGPRDIPTFSRQELYSTDDQSDLQNIAKDHPEVLTRFIRLLRAYPNYAARNWRYDMVAKNASPESPGLRLGFQCK